MISCMRKPRGILVRSWFVVSRLALARTPCQHCGMQRAQLIRRILADCYCRLQPSPIHGIGVFAVRDIPRGRNPFRTLPKYARPGYVRITDDELDALPPKTSGLIRTLFVPTNGTMYLP